jgi:hypothetical protein
MPGTRRLNPTGPRASGGLPHSGAHPAGRNRHRLALAGFPCHTTVHAGPHTAVRQEIAFTAQARGAHASSINLSVFAWLSVPSPAVVGSTLPSDDLGASPLPASSKASSCWIFCRFLTSSRSPYSPSCRSGLPRAFAPRFFRTRPRGIGALALRYAFTAIRLTRGLSPPSCRTCPAHRGRPAFRRAL